MIVKVPLEVKQTGSGFSGTVRGLEDVDKGTKKVTKGFGDLSSQIKTGFGLGLGVAALKGFTDALGGVARAIHEMVVRGGEVENVGRAFQTLAGDYNGLLAASRRATHGMVSDFQLQQAANKGILLGLPITAREMGVLGRTAISLGKAMNVGPTQAMDDLITGLGRGSAMILDNLGITVKAGEANERYAASIGKQSRELTDAEKKLAFYRAAVDAARQKVEEMGAVTLTAADRVQQLATSWENFTDKTSVQVTNALKDLAGSFSGLDVGVQGALDTFSTAFNVIINGFVNMANIGTSAIDSMVSVVGAGVETISSHFRTLKAVISGDLNPLQALKNIATETKAGIAGIEAGLGKLNTSVVFKDYSALMGGGGVGRGGGGSAAGSAGAAGKQAELSWKEANHQMELYIKYTHQAVEGYDWMAGAAERAIQLQTDALMGEVEAYDAIGGAIQVAQDDLDALTAKTFDWQGALQGVALLAGAIGGRFGEMIQVVGNLGDSLKDWKDLSGTGKFNAIAGGVGQIGGVIGGRGGSFLSGAAGGAMTGLAVGGPIGAVAGGLIGGIAGLFGGGDDEAKRAEEERQRTLQAIRDDLGGAFADLASQTEYASAGFLRVLQAAKGTREATEWISRNLDLASGGADKIAEGLQYLSNPEAAKAAAGVIVSTIERDVFERGITAAAKYAESLEETISNLEERGVDVSRLGFDRAQRLVDLSRNEAVVGLSGVAHGLGDTIKGQLNAGVVDEATIRQSATAAAGTFEELQKQGLTDREAYMEMASYLSAVKAASEASGTAIPEEVRNMIAQAEALGITITGDQGLATTNTLLKQILEAIGGGAATNRGGPAGNGDAFGGGRPAGYPESMPWPPRQFAMGGRGVFGSGELIEAHGREVIIPESTITAAQNAGGGTAEITPGGAVIPGRPRRAPARPGPTVNVSPQLNVSIDANASREAREDASRAAVDAATRAFQERVPALIIAAREALSEGN